MALNIKIQKKTTTPEKEPAIKEKIKIKVASNTEPKKEEKQTKSPKKKGGRKRLKPKICENCKKEYQPKHKTQRFCSLACSIEASKKGKVRTKEDIQKQVKGQMMDLEKVFNDLKPFLQHGASLHYACNATKHEYETVRRWLKVDIENLPEKYELVKEDIREFQRQVALAKEFVNFAATKVIQKKIYEEGDDYNARWWLEKRNPDFIPKQKQNIDATNKTLIVWGLPPSPYVDKKKLPNN